MAKKPLTQIQLDFDTPPPVTVTNSISVEPAEPVRNDPPTAHEPVTVSESTPLATEVPPKLDVANKATATTREVTAAATRKKRALLERLPRCCTGVNESISPNG